MMEFLPGKINAELSSMSKIISVMFVNKTSNLFFSVKTVFCD